MVQIIRKQILKERASDGESRPYHISALRSGDLEGSCDALLIILVNLVRGWRNKVFPTSAAADEATVLAAEWMRHFAHRYRFSIMVPTARPPRAHPVRAGSHLCRGVLRGRVLAMPAANARRRSVAEASKEPSSQRAIPGALLRGPLTRSPQDEGIGWDHHGTAVSCTVRVASVRGSKPLS